MSYAAMDAPTAWQHYYASQAPSGSITIRSLVEPERYLQGEEDSHCSSRCGREQP